MRNLCAKGAAETKHAELHGATSGVDGAAKFTLDLRRARATKRRDHASRRVEEGIASSCCLDHEEWSELDCEWLEDAGLIASNKEGLLKAMLDEHLSAADSHTPFDQQLEQAASSPSRHHAHTHTTPAAEWLCVAGPSALYSDGTFDESSLPSDPTAAAAAAAAIAMAVGGGTSSVAAPSGRGVPGVPASIAPT